MARPNGSVAIIENRVILLDVLPHVSIRLKTVFAKIAKTETKTFRLPLTDEVCTDLLWFFERYPFVMSEGILNMMKRAEKRYYEAIDAIDAILLPDWHPPEVSGFKPGYAMYPAQAQGAEIWHKRGGLLLGDDVGLGKTFAAMGGLMKTDMLPAAIVVEPHLPQQWIEEFILPATYFSVHEIVGTTQYKVPTADLYIFRYSNIAGWVDLGGSGFFRSLVFDEIQQGRTGSESAKGQAMAKFADAAAKRIGLSATPIFNYGSEIWNIMRYIDPDLLGPWEQFVIEWCQMGSNGKWLVKDPQALGSFLRQSGAFLRRLRQGRPVNKMVIKVDADPDISEKAEALAKELAHLVLNGGFSESGQAARQLDALARQVTGVAKAKSIAAYVRMFVQAGEPIILAGWHREVYKIWMEELSDLNPIMYTGSETTAKKNAAKRDFINGKSDIFIISSRSGAGLDGLQHRASTVIIGELDWSPLIYEQLFGRVDRPGQTKSEITAIFLVTDTGSDPTLMQVNSIKRSQARGITDPDAMVEVVHSDDSHIKMLAQRYIDGDAA